MKKNIIILLYIFILTSCLYEDKGNYDYKYLPEFTIEGIEKNYGEMLLFSEPLKINPIINFKGEGDEAYEFAWYRKVGKNLTLISATKDLNFVLNDVGSYVLRFEVTHKETGFKLSKETSCNVHSEMERGFYLLKLNNEGNTEMDAHLQSLDGTYKKVENVITLATGAALEGEPRSLDYNKFRYNNEELLTLEEHNALFPTSSKDIAVIDLASYKHLASFEDLFNETMPEKSLRKIKSLRSNNQVQTFVYENEEGKNKIRTRHAQDHFTFGSEYDDRDIDEKGFCSQDYSQNVMFFDKESGDFVRVGGTTTKYGVLSNTTFPTLKITLTMKGFDDCNLEFMGQSSGSVGFIKGKSIGYMIMRKTVDTDSAFLCQLNPKVPTSYSMMHQIDTLSVKKYAFLDADLRTLHQDGNVMYFTIGNSVCKYTMNVKKEEIDILRIPENEEITWIKYLKNDYVDTPLRFSSLLIATYDKAADTYKLSSYNLNSSENPESEPYLVLTGKGRVHSALYTIPIFIGGSTYFKHYYYY